MPDTKKVKKPSLVSVDQAVKMYLKKDSKDGEHVENLGKTLEKLLEALQRAPLRGATYISPVTDLVNTANIVRGKVILNNGDQGCAIFLDQRMAKEVKRGDKVWLDMAGNIIIAWEPQEVQTGQVCEMVGKIDSDRIHVKLDGGREKVLYLSDKLWAGQEDMSPGMKLLCEPRTEMALDLLTMDEKDRYSYLQRVAVPNISIEDDIGDPPAYLARMCEHIMLGMTQPELLEKYGLRKSSAVLLEGVSGSGKTYSILGLWRRMYEIISHVTGAPISDIPPRVFKLDCSKVLSMWFGESDRKISNFFDEVEDMVAKPVTIGGKEWNLPVLVIAEEIDGIARRRGSDPIYDRIQTTLLGRMDATAGSFVNYLSLFVCTTNTPHLVDEAFMRRAGGEIEHFGHLEQKGFASVLDKHIKHVPLAREGNQTAKEAKREVMLTVGEWLFPEDEEDGHIVVVETNEGPVFKGRSDFLTCGLVDRAVQQATRSALQEEAKGGSNPGMTPEMLRDSFKDQVEHIARQLQPHNVRNYLTLPDGVEVSEVIRDK